MASAYPVSLTRVGFAIETVRGQAQAPAFWDPVKSPDYEIKQSELADETLGGSMVQTYDMVDGMRYDTHGWELYPHLDTFGVYLRALLGSSDGLTAAPTSTTLSAQATAGATTIQTAVALTAGSYYTIGAGASLEGHLVKSVAGTTATLMFPLRFAQASGAAVSGLTSHQFSVLNTGQGQPPSVTITDYDGEEWRQLTASQLDKLTLKGTATDLVDATVSWFANPATTPATPSPSATATQAPPGWSTFIAVGGTPVTHFVDWEWDFGRGVKPIPALTGTQEYYQYFAGPLTCPLKITVLERANAPELTDYENGATKSFDFAISDRTSGNVLHIHSSVAKYTSGKLDRSKEWVEVPLEVQPLPSAADATAGGVSPVLVTLANSQTASY